MKGREMARKDEWRCGLATFQIALAKLWNEMKHEIWSVWEKVIPLTVLSFSFAEFLFTLVIVMLLTSSPTSVVFLQNFHWGVCCCLLSFLYLAGFYLLATIFHPLVPRWVSLCVCVCVCVRFFPLTMYAVQGDIQLWCFFGLVWWLLADRLEKLYIYMLALYFPEWLMVVLRHQVGVIYCAELQWLFTKLFTLFFSVGTGFWGTAWSIFRVKVKNVCHRLLSLPSLPSFAQM